MKDTWCGSVEGEGVSRLGLRPRTSTTGVGLRPRTSTTSDAAELLAEARDARQRECAAAADQLRLACAWADLHPAESVDTAAGWTVDGYERAVPLAGVGTPLVAEFCVAELTTVLGLSPDAGRALLGEALELRHRLPRIWARVQGLGVPAWRARRIARATMTLTPEGAAFVDGQVAHVAHRVGAVTVDRLVEEATARFEPDRAKAERAARAEGRCFHVNHTQVAFDGTSTVYGVLDLADALDLDAAVTARAGLLAALGSADTLDVRRAVAVGEIARADLTLDLHTEVPEDLDRAAKARLRRARRDTTLVVHLAAAALQPARPSPSAQSSVVEVPTRPSVVEVRTRPSVVEVRTRSVSLETTSPGFEARPGARTSTTGETGARTSTSGVGGFEARPGARTSTTGETGFEARPGARTSTTGETGARTSTTGEVWVGRVENTRTPITADQIRDWLAVDGARIMVRPVLDLDQHVHVTRYEIPDRLADQTRLRDTTCAFPWCERPARTADIDHVVPHADGGETATDNTAALCRRHHRLKTHSRWRYRVLDPGTYLWTSPHGHQYVRDHTGTREADGAGP